MLTILSSVLGWYFQLLLILQFWRTMNSGRKILRTQHINSWRKNAHTFKLCAYYLCWWSCPTVLRKMVLKNYNDLKANQVNDCNITITKIKCHWSKRYMAWKKKALRKQCYTFLAGQSTAREKPSQRIPTYEQIICIEI